MIRAVAVGMAVLLFLLSGCSASQESRPVTTEEAQILATTRFHNFNAGVRSLRFDVRSQGRQLAFSGWYDWVDHVGYGLLKGRAQDQQSALALLLWNATSVGSHPVASTAASAPLPIPDVESLDTEWTGTLLEPGESGLDTILGMMPLLGQDRPENALLVQQNGARFEGTEELNGATVSVFSVLADNAETRESDSADSQSNTRLYVNEQGLLMRLGLRLGDGAEWTFIEFGEAPGVELGDPFAESG